MKLLAKIVIWGILLSFGNSESAEACGNPRALPFEVAKEQPLLGATKLDFMAKTRVTTQIVRSLENDKTYLKVYLDQREVKSVELGQAEIEQYSDAIKLLSQTELSIKKRNAICKMMPLEERSLKLYQANRCGGYSEKIVYIQDDCTKSKIIRPNNEQDFALAQKLLKSFVSMGQSAVFEALYTQNL